MKTAFITEATAQRTWFLIDAEGLPLGRVAARVASIIRGKAKPSYTPSQETGDFVIVINAEKVAITGRKAQDKLYHHHTGYPGGLKTVNFNSLVTKHPTQPLENAVRGMLPKGPLGRKIFKNVKIYEGKQHPHSAQNPATITI